MTAGLSVSSRNSGTKNDHTTDLELVMLPHATHVPRFLTGRPNASILTPVPSKKSQSINQSKNMFVHCTYILDNFCLIRKYNTIIDIHV